MNAKNLLLDWQPLKAVPGLTFRHFAGEADHHVHLALANACKKDNAVDHAITLEDIVNDEKWNANYNIRQQLIFVELDHKPIGYCGYSWDQELDGKVIFFPFGSLLRQHWGAGIANLMVTFVEEKCREIAAAQPAEKPKVFRIWKKKAATEIIDYHKSRGYEIERYFFAMKRPIDLPTGEPPLPPGVEIRPVEPGQYRAIWDAEWEAFRDHWGYTAPTEEMFEAQLKDRLFQPHLWKVAWQGDQVCGKVGNFFDAKENEEFHRKRGYTENISVCRPWRGKGVAKALIAESVRMFREMGMEETYLGVDADNTSGAVRLYTDMGYETEEEKTSYMLCKPL